MGKIIRYKHHGELVSVDEELKGKHREHCLCWKCGLFIPDNREANCPMANIFFALCVELNVVLPVWECPRYYDASGQNIKPHTEA